MNSRGFSLVEVLLAVSIFSLIVTGFVGGLLYGQESTAIAGQRERAIMLADEGLEAVRNIRDENFSNLTDGTYGLTITGNQWNISGSSDTTDIFTRQVAISAVDTKRKLVTANIAWQQNSQRTGSVSMQTYLTNWQGTPTPSPTPTSTPTLTPTPTPTPVTCNSYALSQGYGAGTCRQNTAQCTSNGETHLAGGDAFCTGGPSVDTCCVLPTPTSTPTPTNTPTPGGPTATPTPTPATCATYCVSFGGYTTGTCRQNANQCTNNGETHQAGGDAYCTGGASVDTCCCQP